MELDSSDLEVTSISHPAEMDALQSCALQFAPNMVLPPIARAQPFHRSLFLKSIAPKRTNEELRSGRGYEN